MNKINKELEITEKKAGIIAKVMQKLATPRPPKGWWDKMYSDVKKKNPSYSEDQVSKTIGNIWFNELSNYRRNEIKKRYYK